MTPELVATLCSVILALVGLVGKLIFDRRKTPSTRPPPPRSMLPQYATPRDPKAAVDFPKLAGQIGDLHECHLGQHAYDEDGVPKWWNKPSLERAIREMKEHAKEASTHSKRQTQLLESIARSLDRETGSRP